MPNSRVLLFRGHDATSRAVRALGAALLVAVLITAGTAIYRLHQKAVWNQRQRAAGQALALTAHADQVFAVADFIIRTMEQEVFRANPRTTDELHRAFDTAAENNQLSFRDASFQPISLLAVVDSDGQMVSFSRKGPTPNVILSDRDYFLDAKNGRSGVTYVGTATPSRVTGAWAFYLARRIETREGKFLGVVTASISCDYLADFYEQLRMGHVKASADTAITMVRDDLSVLARAPKQIDLLGKRLRADGAYASLSPTAVTTAQATSAVSTWDDAANSAPHVELVSQHLAKFPASVVIATKDTYYLEAWWREVAAIVSTAGVALAFFVYMFSALIRVLRRREELMTEGQRLRVAAETASNAKSQFLATVSHEIRTPMNGILGTAELLARCELSAEPRRLADALLRSGKSLLRILNDILDFSKIEAGELQISPTTFAVKTIVQDVYELFESYAHGKGLTLRVVVAEDVPPFNVGDPDRVRQVLGNLTSNAVKFTERGVVVLKTVVSESAGKSALRFEVEDTGIGIPDDARERIFEVFAQADNSVERRFGGSGLGLAISKRIVALMGGKIDFRSKLGRGTCFWFEIPLILPAVCRDIPTPSGVASSESGSPNSDVKQLHAGAIYPMHVLVVEDNAVNAMVVEAQLASLNASCDVAIDGQDALTHLRRFAHYDLVLMDCMLPGLSGYEATRIWRAEEASSTGDHVPIIALTANALASNAKHAREAGMDGFLTKPCSHESLAEVLREVTSGERFSTRHATSTS